MPGASILPDLTITVWAIAGAIGVASLSIIGKIVFDADSKCNERRADRRTIAAAIAGEVGGYLDALNPEVTGPAYQKLAAIDQITRVQMTTINGLSSNKWLLSWRNMCPRLVRQ